VYITVSVPLKANDDTIRESLRRRWPTATVTIFHHTGWCPPHSVNGDPRHKLAKEVTRIVDSVIKNE